MATLKVPSLQHLARIWHHQPEKVQRHLVGLAKHPPTFSYNPMYDAVRDMLRLGITYEEIERGISTHVKRADVRQNFLEILPLLQNYLKDLTPDYVHNVAPRYLPLARDILVPFTPPLIYGFNGEMHFPWFVFWKDNPLRKKRLSLFVSIVDDVMKEDPDLGRAKFHIIDMSAPAKDSDRTLKIYDASHIPRVSELEKRRMLTTIVEGYRLAQKQLAKSEAARSAASDDVEVTNQYRLKLDPKE